MSGCTDDSNRNAGVEKPFTGVSLTLRFPDTPFADVLTPAARSWADRTGAKVTIVVKPFSPGDEADVGVIDAAQFGAWAERGELAAVPAALRSPEHPFQWMNVLPAYREQLIEWGGLARAVPLAGDGYVILYRADRLRDPKFVAEFQAQFQRAPAAPTTWDDFADLATAFSKADNKPTVAPLTGPELATLFFRIAACHDRLAQSDSNKSQDTTGNLERISFQFDLTTGQPRLISPPFAAAALTKDGASLAVVSLAQLARLPREKGAVPARYGLAPVPGVRSAYDREKKKLIPLTGTNYVPYFAGGRLGVVLTRCKRPDAAFDLLAELGGPTRSLEAVASAEMGAGPFRVTHLDRDHQFVWYGYGLDAARTDQLRTALLNYVQVDAKTATYGLRGPDQAPLSEAAAAVLAKIAAGGTPGEAGLKLMTDEWNTIDAKTPPDVRLKWRKMAAGMN
jgi:ABC-type glycerol-3-phosphate transport system substrate-binding protein